jgi:DNA-binding response OmpR family regulator
MPRILSISRNPMLLATRNDALALSGYAVASPKQPSEGVVMLQQEHFDAVVIGDSVEPEIRKVMIPTLRNVRPDVPILFVHAESQSTVESLADVSVDVTAGPTPLVRALDNRLRKAESR